MQNGEELLAYFRKEINAEVEKELAQINAETKRIRDEAYAKLESTARQEASEKAQKEMANLEAANAKEISKMQTQYNKQLISQRQELQDAIFDACRQKLQEFTQTKDYTDWMTKHFDAIQPNQLEGKAQLQVNARDQKLAEAWAKKHADTLTVQASEEIQIGGFVLINYAKGIVLDQSLDNRLSEQEEWFYNHSGLMIK